MKILETGTWMVTGMAYMVSAVGLMRALISAFLQVVIASLKIPVRTLVCQGSCSLRHDSCREASSVHPLCDSIIALRPPFTP